MLAQKIRNKYIVQLSVGIKHIKLVVDTGSPFTILSAHSISMIYGCSEDTVLRFIRKQSYVNAKSFSSGKLRLVPIYLRNVVLSELDVPVFNAFVCANANSGSSLLGVDFLSACTVGESSLSEGLHVIGADTDVYNSNFRDLCAGVEPQEICEVVEDLDNRNNSVRGLIYF